MGALLRMPLRTRVDRDRLPLLPWYTAQPRSMQSILVQMCGLSENPGMTRDGRRLRLTHEEGMNVIPRSTISALLPDRAQSVWKSLMSSRTLRLLSFLFQAEGSLCRHRPQLLKPVDLIAVSSAFPSDGAAMDAAPKLADQSIIELGQRRFIGQRYPGSIIIGLLRCAARYWTKWSCSVIRESGIPTCRDAERAKSSKVLRQSALGLIDGKIKPTGPAAVVISGGSIDPEQHRAIVEDRYRRAG